MFFKDNIVSVRYENSKSGGYSENAFSYYSEVPDIKVGDIVKVPTKYGERRAIVHKVGISENTLPAALRKHLKTITADCLVTGNEVQTQLQIDLSNPAEDFFK